MNWEIILWTCATVAALFFIGAIIMGVMSARNMKKRRMDIAELQQAIKPGVTVLFAGGIYGKVIKIKEDIIDVEIGKNMIIQISPYSIQTVQTGNYQ